MQEINEELENDRSVLEWMLGQYVRAKRRKKGLFFMQKGRNTEQSPQLFAHL